MAQHNAAFMNRTLALLNPRFPFGVPPCYAPARENN
jgi:hypothetical protein